jgi:hypothetical protein
LLFCIQNNEKTSIKEAAMENQQQNKQQASSKGSETKKQSNQPTYGDKPWQNPPYGQQNPQNAPASEQSKDSGKDDSCGCGSDSEKGNKKETATTKRS